MPKLSLSPRSLAQKHRRKSHRRSWLLGSRSPNRRRPSVHRPAGQRRAQRNIQRTTLSLSRSRGGGADLWRCCGSGGRPTSARRVGYALSALSAAKGAEVPWWRVVNARGEVSPRSGSLAHVSSISARTCWKKAHRARRRGAALAFALSLHPGAAALALLVGRLQPSSASKSAAYLSRSTP